MTQGRISPFSNQQGQLEIHQTIDSLNNHSRGIISSNSLQRALILIIFQDNNRLLIILDNNRLPIIEILLILTSYQMNKDSKDLNRHNKDHNRHSKDHNRHNRDNKCREENHQELIIYSESDFN